jgi:glycerol-3-phosphate O-acyltransferase
MDSTITLPYWLFMLLCLFALVMVLDRILLPGMRWYLRRRVNRVIQEVNTRLDLQIRPFQLTRRQALIDQLMFDDKVVEAIRDYAQEQDIPQEVAHAKALRYAGEIAPAFNAYVYFRLGYWLAKKIGRLVYRIRVGFYDDNQLRDIPRDSSVVFVMNHRSNMDYVLVSFLVAEKAALSYAVGEWARIWPLQTLIKSMGAFFVRRDSRNVLYRRVLERYINLSTRAGVTQAVFLEGGLTRDGKLREPRLGFLDYMLRDYQPGIDRDIYFVPVGINYDRVIEDRSLLRALEQNAARRSTWFILKTSLGFFFKTLLLDRKTRWQRFGYASVNFGKPVSADDFCRHLSAEFRTLDTEERFVCMQQLAQDLMQQIAQVIPILPVSLLAEILLAEPDLARSALELKSRAMARLNQLEDSGAPVDIDAVTFDHVMSSALDTLTGRGVLELDEGLYRIAPQAGTLLLYYANSIAHWQDSNSVDS